MTGNPGSGIAGTATAGSKYCVVQRFLSENFINAFHWVFINMSYTIKEAQGQVAMLKFKGVFDYDGLTTYIIKWLHDRHYHVNEKTHKHKMSCPHGFEIERAIVAYRDISEFYRYHVKVGMFLWDAFQVDAVKGGKKLKLWNARMTIKISFKVECDYTNKWSTGPFMHNLLKFFCEYIIKKEIIIKHADSLYYKLLGFHTNLKQFLGMETAVHFK